MSIWKSSEVEAEAERVAEMQATTQGQVAEAVVRLFALSKMPAHYLSVSLWLFLLVPPL